MKIISKTVVSYLMIFIGFVMGKNLRTSIVTDQEEKKQKSVKAVPKNVN